MKLLAICIGLLMLTLPAKARDTLPAEAVAGILQEIQSATSAEVFIVKNSISTITKITQDDVPKYGCRFSVDPNEIGDLLASGDAPQEYRPHLMTLLDETPLPVVIKAIQ